MFISRTSHPASLPLSNNLSTTIAALPQPPYQSSIHDYATRSKPIPAPLPPRAAEPARARRIVAADIVKTQPPSIRAYSKHTPFFHARCAPSRVHHDNHQQVRSLRAVLDMTSSWMCKCPGVKRGFQHAQQPVLLWSSAMAYCAYRQVVR
ncbi:hypothetical protein EK21DRAFT_86260 [Setomelanomma holmii]|uniref:Uncharacterized protein n=1 Tax=Setomelanomma holmii TaxID=210430 RepID=A0A9P4HFC5_9PLEO|nr:hypothetical protein EK21DRAFT_86260 [Setomelanomma holmii]